MTLKTRSETTHKKLAFHNAMERYHCIVSSTGFFEYQTRGKEKVSYFKYPKESEILSVAGIYDIYENPLYGLVTENFQHTELRIQRYDGRNTQSKKVNA